MPITLRKIFRICDDILGRKQDLPLPPGHTDEELAERFNKFFTTKIMNIWENLKAIHKPSWLRTTTTLLVSHNLRNC